MIGLLKVIMNFGKTNIANCQGIPNKEYGKGQGLFK